MDTKLWQVEVGGRLTLGVEGRSGQQCPGKKR